MSSDDYFDSFFEISQKVKVQVGRRTCLFIYYYAYALTAVGRIVHAILSTCTSTTLGVTVYIQPDRNS